MSDILNKAQKKQEQLVKTITESPEIQKQRPVFHFATMGGWCNDPNGFSQFNGRVHLFYQYHPYSTQWGPMHWGHVTTEDFLTWQQERVALAPDTEADITGCFSGTAFEDNKNHIIAYTGVTENWTQNQCIAIGNGETYVKLKENPVITAKNLPFEYNTQHFRDPKIWKKGNFYYMACVLKQKNDKGALVLFSSEDLKNWQFKGVLDSSKDNLSNMWECPDVLNLDGKDLIILSPQEMKEDYKRGFRDGNNSLYISGRLDYEKALFIRELRLENDYTAAQIDYGIDFYAPEATKLKDGRTIMIGWMQSWESYITPENYIWSGMMTIPREISYKNGRLYQLPVRELENWKCDLQNQELCENKEEVISAKRCFELDIELIPTAEGSIKITLENIKKESVFVELNFDENYIFFDRTNSLTPGNIKTRKAKLTDKPLKIKVLCDTCSIEVFINEGTMAFTNAFFFSEEQTFLHIKNSTSGKIRYQLSKILKKES